MSCQRPELRLPPQETEFHQRPVPAPDALLQRSKPLYEGVERRRRVICGREGPDSGRQCDPLLRSGMQDVEERPQPFSGRHHLRVFPTDHRALLHAELAGNMAQGEMRSMAHRAEQIATGGRCK